MTDNKKRTIKIKTFFNYDYTKEKPEKNTGEYKIDCLGYESLIEKLNRYINNGIPIFSPSNDQYSDIIEDPDNDYSPYEDERLHFGDDGQTYIINNKGKTNESITKYSNDVERSVEHSTSEELSVRSPEDSTDNKE